MFSLSNAFARLNKQFRRQSYGWIGIEIGCHAIQLTQLQRLNQQWLIAGHWTIEQSISKLPSELQVKPEQAGSFGWIDENHLASLGLSGSYQELDSVHSIFRRNECAVTLSDGFINYRELELPEGDKNESQSMVRSEIALESQCEPEELLTSCWKLLAGRLRSSVSTFGTVSLKRTVAVNIANDLLRAGMECQVLDAVPCAMARAVTIASADPQQAWLAIDLGYHQSTLTLVVDQRPVLSRSLRQHGLLPLLIQVASAFDVSLADAEFLLLSPASSPESSSKPSAPVSNPLSKCLSSWRQRIAGEIDRTAHFINRTYSSIRAPKVMLMGIGAQLMHVQESGLGDGGLPMVVWSMPVADEIVELPNPAKLAIAAGLSALAWEGVVCT